MHVYINNQKGSEKFKNFQTIFDGIFSYTVIMGKTTSKIKCKKDIKICWKTQGGDFTTIKK